jgi:hypothetical protein
MSVPDAKKPRLDNPVILTHSGTFSCCPLLFPVQLTFFLSPSGSFHCDESLAVSLLRLLPQYQNATLVRSRDPEEWAKADVVMDVGGTYEPEKHRYDHHQRGFDEVFGHGFVTKLSSAGLIYKCVQPPLEISRRSGSTASEDPFFGEGSIYPSSGDTWRGRVDTFECNNVVQRLSKRY